MRRALTPLPVVALALGILGSSAVASSAHAEPGGAARTEADRTRARELMREGNELYGDGRLADAFTKYLEAWRTAQAFDIACNLGGTASELAMNRDAAEYLDYCLRHYAASSRPEAVAAEQRARAAFDVVRAKVAAVNLKVSPAGAEVFVDGARIGRAPLEAPVFLEAGPHRIEARQDGLDSGMVELNAKRGEATDALIELKPASGTATAAVIPETNEEQPPPDPPLESKNYVPAIVTASVGGLALAGGVVFLVMHSSKQSDASDKLDTLNGSNPCGAGSPSENKATCTEVADLSEQAATFGTLSIVSFGVAAGAGVATYLLWPKGTETGFRGLRPAVAASPEGLYASVRGAF